jgi:hypothetical protein
MKFCCVLILYSIIETLFLIHFREFSWEKKRRACLRTAGLPRRKEKDSDLELIAFLPGSDP